MTWGVDKIKIAVQVDLAACDSSSSIWTRSTSRKLSESEPEAETLVGDVDLGGNNVHIVLYAAQSVCHIEFNPARFVGDGVLSLCPPSAVPKLAELILKQLAAVVWPRFASVEESSGEILWSDSWALDVRIKRLDLARDFFVQEIQSLKAPLQAIQGRYQRERVSRESSGNGWTVTNNTKSAGSDRIYNKTHELMDKGVEQSTLGECGEANIIRFETQMKDERLAASGLARLAQVDDANCWNALATRWQSSRWGEPLPMPGDLLVAVSSLKPAIRIGLLGYLHMAAAGAVHEFSASQQKLWRMRAKACGLQVGMPVQLMGQASHRLDLEAGRLVAVAEDTESRAA